MNSKPLPQVITIDYWWDKTKSTQGRYRVLMATGLVLCCLFVFSLLLVKLIIEILPSVFELLGAVLNLIHDRDTQNDYDEDEKMANFYRDKYGFGTDYANMRHGPLDGEIDD